ncbi:cyclase [Cohnella kolymensis]|uniref:Cyclase n=1 Tax=Cohnella kolymensis TaxID=1590652 RepID=A0ABR5A4C0_9BACL|nr:MBL fold metallo-hydrolase [Cohnella kolymensis]KIL35478.1 cyclase [Cohnella kolymensis]
MASISETIPVSKHFRLQKVAEGVFAAISYPGTGSLGNAAIVDLGDETLVVDSLLTLQAAQDLKDAAEHLTGRPVSYVFNTHWHGDHTCGNQVFAPDARIISTGKTREVMATAVEQRLSRHRAEPELLYRAIDEYEEKMKQEKNEKIKQEMQWEIASDREYMKMLPNLVNTLPNLTFDQQLTIHGSRRTVELITYGGGHTESDAFLYLPEDKAAIMGDLVLSDHHPVMSHGNPQQWLQILDKVEALNPEIIVPGHGNVCSRNSIHQVRSYIHHIFALAADILRNDLNIDDIPVPESYQAWYFTSDFKSNLSMVRERLSQQKD